MLGYLSFAQKSLKPTVRRRDNPAPIAAIVAGVGAVGRGFLKRVFKVPAHVRAEAEAPALFAKALGGDKAAAIELERLTRWAATDRAKRVYRRFYDRLPRDLKPAPEEKAPPAPPPPPVATGGATGSRPAADEGPTERAVPPTPKESASREAKISELEPAPRRAPRRAAAPRAPKRLISGPAACPPGKHRNPLTGRCIKDKAPPRARARKATRAETAARRRVEKALGTAVTGLVAKGLAAAKAIGFANVATVGAAGAVAYLATKAIRDGIAEGETVTNFVARSRSRAATIFQREMGRRPSVAEYATLRSRVAAIITDAVQAGAPGFAGLAAKWRNFVRLFKGA